MKLVLLVTTKFFAMSFWRLKGFGKPIDGQNQGVISKGGTVCPLFLRNFKTGGLKKSGVLPNGVVKGFVPSKIGDKFFTPDGLPREALAKELSNKDCNKTGGLFKPGFLF